MLAALNAVTETEFHSRMAMGLKKFKHAKWLGFWVSPLRQFRCDAFKLRY